MFEFAETIAAAPRDISEAAQPDAYLDANIQL
jgi:hypothetical protein